MGRQTLLSKRQQHEFNRGPWPPAAAAIPGAFDRRGAPIPPCGDVRPEQKSAADYFRDALCLSEESKKLDRCVDRVYAPDGVLR